MQCQGAGAIVRPAVFFIPDDGVASFRQVHPDLVFAAGEEVDLEQGEPFCLFQDRILGMGELARCRVRGGVDRKGAVLGQVAADRPRFLRQGAIDDRKIALVGFLPVPLQKDLGRFAPGKDQDAGGLAVEPVDDVDPVA